MCCGCCAALSGHQFSAVISTCDIKHLSSGNVHHLTGKLKSLYYCIVLIYTRSCILAHVYIHSTVNFLMDYLFHLCYVVFHRNLCVQYT